MKNLIHIALLAVLVSCISDPNSHTDLQTTKDSHKVNHDSLKVVLENMYDKDQEIRRKLDSVGLNSPNAGRYITEMMRTDSVNQVHIKKILNEYGWLPKSRIGEKAGDAIFYVIQHSDIASMEQYFPQLKQLAVNGEAEKTYAAMMEDRLLMWRGRKQKYGTQAYSSALDNNKPFIWPVENPDSVNQLRKNAGFELTVEENAERLGAEYNRNQKLPEKN